MKINIPSKFSFSKGSIYTFINPFSLDVLLTQENKKEIFEKFIIHPDGISISKILSIKGTPINRVSFDDTSIAKEVFLLAEAQDLKIGLIGSSKETISKAALLVREKYNLKEIIYHDGFFDIGEFKNYDYFFNCDIIICSMGTPKQENLLLKMKKLGWQGTGFTCGGYFDQLVSSEGAHYYPRIINKLNLRWAYRIYKEPRRLWKRYLINYPRGIFKLIKILPFVTIKQ